MQKVCCCKHAGDAPTGLNKIRDRDKNLTRTTRFWQFEQNTHKLDYANQVACFLQLNSHTASQLIIFFATASSSTFCHLQEIKKKKKKKLFCKNF